MRDKKSGIPAIQLIRSVILCLFCLPASAQTPVEKQIRHFTFFSQEREGIHDSIFWKHPAMAGAQITYPWKRLEPAPGVYDFHEIEEDLRFLQSKGKKLFIQIQDVSFDSTMIQAPKYLLQDTLYHGGADAHYEITHTGTMYKCGWMARRWDPAVAERFHRLLEKLGEQFDGRIEGINLPETAVDFVPDHLPAGYSPQVYLEAIKQNTYVLRNAFPHSQVIQYANFMPGERHANLEELYRYAREIKAGMGGPDIMVYRKFQMKNSYPLIKDLAGAATTGMAVQDGNYSLINPQTGKQVTVEEIYNFAREYLNLDYIFWCTEAPYYTTEVLPFLESLGTNKN